MTRYNINNRALHWRKGSFHPNGVIQVIGNRRMFSNPVLETFDETFAARVIVGFNRLGKRAVTVKQLISIVREVRTEQVGNPSSSFLLQRGIYQHRSGEIVEEPGAQVMIIDVTGATQKEFERQMVELAEVIAEELEQESVIVELQRNGITQRTLSVGP